MTQEEYKALYKKMLNDEEFFKRIEPLTDKKDIYLAYKEFGYTDMEYDDFIVEFDSRTGRIIEECNKRLSEKKELSDEELDHIVGGVDLFQLITGIVAFVPGVGPVLSGLARGIKEGINGNDKKAGIDILTGFACGLIDGVVPVFGAGAAFKEVGKIALGVGLGAAKVTANSLIDEFF